MPTHLVDKKMACELLQRPESQLKMLVKQGFIRPIRKGRNIKYDRDEILDMRYVYDTMGDVVPNAMTLRMLVAKTARLEADVRLLMRLADIEKPRLVLTIEEGFLLYDQAVQAFTEPNPLTLEVVEHWAMMVTRLDESCLIRVHQATGDPLPPKMFYQLIKRLFTELERVRDEGNAPKKDLESLEIMVSKAHRHILALTAMFLELDLHAELRESMRDKLDDLSDVDRKLATALKPPQK